MWPPAHPLCRAKAGIGGMAWWEGGGDSWEGKEVRWWATDRLVRGPTVNLAAFRSLRPSTCWILADREGGGVAVEGKCGVRNPQTASWSTPNMVVSPANRPGGRGDRRGYSRPARRDVPPAGVWCVPGVPCQHPSMVCHWERPNRYCSRGGSRVAFGARNLGACDESQARALSVYPYFRMLGTRHRRTLGSGLGLCHRGCAWGMHAP